MCVRSQMNGTRSSPQLPSLAVRLAGCKFLIRAPEIPHYNNFLNSRLPEIPAIVLIKVRFLNIPHVTTISGEAQPRGCCKVYYSESDETLQHH